LLSWPPCFGALLPHSSFPGTCNIYGNIQPCLGLCFPQKLEESKNIPHNNKIKINKNKIKIDEREKERKKERERKEDLGAGGSVMSVIPATQEAEIRRLMV
jgi:hypothetical protein